MKFITLSFFLLITAVGLAQGIKVQGKVLDGDFNMEPLAFANVQIKGLDMTEETTLNGDFQFQLLAGTYTFVIEFVGYAPIELKDVAVTNNEMRLSPVVLYASKKSYDLASTANEQ